MRFRASLLFLLAAMGCTAPQPKADADATLAIPRTKTLAILPPHIEYRRMLSSGSSERLPESEQFIASQLNPRLEKFRAENFAIPRPSDEKAELEASLAQLNAAFVTALNGRAPEQSEAPLRLTLPAAKDLARSFNADLVLFARFYSIRRTDAEWATAALTGLTTEILGGLAFGNAGRTQAYAPHKQIGSLFIALIDGASGDVIWSGENAVLPNSPPFRRTSAQTVPGAVDNILKRFPARAKESG